MRKFKIVPFSKEYGAKIKKNGVDDFGNAVLEMLATGYGPCRISLKPFNPQVDTRLLFSHSPFEIDNAFNQCGPVFIQKEDVKSYADVHRFPPEIKADKINFPLSLIGYSYDQRMVFTQLVGDNDVDTLIGDVFDAHTEVAYLHARNAEACCFICKIERA